MSDFAGYVCWNRQFVAETVSTEAVHADPDVFLATHRPLRILRSPWEAPETATAVDENDVLTDFTNRAPVGGVVLMPILGESGTGKSHLVRWIREHLPETPRRRVIYLPKTDTNLSNVVHRLLMDVPGEQFDDIRSRVSRSSGQFDRERLPYELLAHLSVALKFHTVEEPDRLRRGFIRMLTSERGLSNLLTDAEFSKHLLKDGGVLTRLAAEVQRGRGRDEGERPFGFNADDLRPEDLATAEMSAVARKIHTQLHTQLDEATTLFDLAAQLLNDNLDKAVLRMVDLGSGRLQQAMVDIRRELHSRGQEIVLLVEDLAVIQGVQGDLLDAISEAGVREGRQELATIRTLLAVTPGYYRDSIPETFRTRASASVSHSYRLDVAVSDGVGDAATAVDQQYLVDFVGRYLNAARLGQQRLAEHRKAVGASADDAAPNACLTCRFRATCHAAFGATSDHFGLYPYNATALVKAVQRSMPRENPQFNPRRVLGHVVRHVLDNYDVALRDGTFPSPRFRSDFPVEGRSVLSAEQVDYLSERDGEHERRVPLLEFWGEATVENLAAGIHEAFRLPPLSDDVLAGASAHAPAPVVAPRRPDEHSRADQGGQRPHSTDSRLEDVEAWHRGRPLPQEVARDVRQLIRDAIVAHVQWDDHGLSTPGVDVRKRLFPGRPTGVVIEGARGDRDFDAAVASSNPAVVVLRRTPANATMIKALLRRQAHGSWDFTDGPQQQRRFARRLSGWGEAMVKAVQHDLGVDDPATLRAAVEISLIGARLLNLTGSRSRDSAALLACLFDFGAGKDDPQRPIFDDEQTRAASYTKLARQHAAVRGPVVAQLRSIVGAAQGTGGEQVVDAARLLPLVQHVRRQWRTSTYPQLPEWIERPHRSLNTSLEKAVEDQWRTAQRLADRIDELIGDSDAGELVTALEEALNAARSAGALSVGADQVKSDLARARNLPWKSFSDVRTGADGGSDDVIDGGSEEGSDAGSDEGFGEAQPGATGSLAACGTSGGGHDDSAGAAAASWSRRFAQASVDRGRSAQLMQELLTTFDALLQSTTLRLQRQLEAQPASPLNDLTDLLDVLEVAVARWEDSDA
ncbi:protein DpdH [Kineococcus sp. SYSU DK005]|uniref:protein DpdH n=1 Tax=Kineococcus sp. SYSU DK005 TaxID=3383126 RepID=UPI003D7E2950